MFNCSNRSQCPIENKTKTTQPREPATMIYTYNADGQIIAQRKICTKCAGITWPPVTLDDVSLAHHNDRSVQ